MTSELSQRIQLWEYLTGDLVKYWYHSWEGDIPVERVGILAASLSGVNQRFWSRLGRSGQNGTIFSGQGVLWLHWEHFSDDLF